MKHSLTMFWLLYKKDLRQMRSICLTIIMLGTVGYAVYQGLERFVYPVNNYSPGEIILIIMSQAGLSTRAIPYMFLAVLALHLYQGRHDDSAYQMLSLPVSKSMTILSAYMSILTYVLIFSIFTEYVNIMFSLYRFHQLTQLPAYIEQYGSGFNVGTLCYIGRTILFNLSRINILSDMYLAGIICLAAGIQSKLVSKSQLTYWFGFISTIFGIFAFDALLVRFEIGILVLSLYLSGPLFAIAGAWLYGQFAEV